MLAGALRVALEAMRNVDGRLVVVDAVDHRAVAFYEHHGFTPVPGNTHRLVIKASSGAKSLSVPRP